MTPSEAGVSSPADAVSVDFDAEHNQYTIPVRITSVAPATPSPEPPVTWTQYVNNLSHWKRTLLADVTFVAHQQLFAALWSFDTLFLASDGGATDRRGSFGALIATRDTIPAECNGRALGADPRLLQADG
jgi:hypothetical protein